MKLSTKGRYGLRAMVDIAVYSQDSPVPISAIAERQNISGRRDRCTSDWNLSIDLSCLSPWVSVCFQGFQIALSKITAEKKATGNINAVRYVLRITIILTLCLCINFSNSHSTDSEKSRNWHFLYHEYRK